MAISWTEEPRQALSLHLQPRKVLMSVCLQCHVEDAATSPAPDGAHVRDEGVVFAVDVPLVAQEHGGHVLTVAARIRESRRDAASGCGGQAVCVRKEIKDQGLEGSRNFNSVIGCVIPQGITSLEEEGEGGEGKGATTASPKSNALDGRTGGAEGDARPGRCDSEEVEVMSSSVCRIPDVDEGLKTVLLSPPSLCVSLSVPLALPVERLLCQSMVIWSERGRRGRCC